MNFRLKMWCLLAVLATTAIACDDEIVDLDLPKDAGAARDGASDAAKGSSDGGAAEAAPTDDSDATDEAGDEAAVTEGDGGSDAAAE